MQFSLTKIGVHLNTIFQNGKRTAALKKQTYTLENLTEENIEKEIVDCIEKILINKITKPAAKQVL